jgi:CRP-like cAMP-binding protein
MYILEQGTCEILVKGQINRRDNVVREIGQGTMFGEIALIYGTRRTASVRSKESCMVGALSEENFNLLIRYFPEIMDRLKKEVRKY